MFKGKYIKLDTILNDVHKYPFVESLSKREAAHSLVNLLGLMGAVMPLERKYKNVEIKLHKGELPQDIMFIHGVNNKGNDCNNKGIAMKYSSDIYHSVLHSDAAKQSCDEITTPTEEEITTLYGCPLSDQVTDPTECNKDINAPVTTYVPDGAYENSYTINAMSIDVSFPSGWVEIAYDSVKTDCDGYPMIPDVASFKEAFKYFILKNAAEPAFYRGLVQRYVFEDIKTQYAWYVAQSANHFNMPSPDQMESMANGLLRIIPREHQYRDGWKSFNRPRE